MTRTDPALARILARRLDAHALSRPAPSVVAAAHRMLALQAQDAAQARWALAVRAEAATPGDVDRAFAGRAVVRTWCLRGTIHAVPSEDAAWLVRLCAPRNIARAAARHRGLGIEARDVGVARDAVERALAGGRAPSREALFAELEAAGQVTVSQRGVHLLWRLAQDEVIAQAGDDFVLLADWVARPRALEGDEALAELATAYRRSHGPSTLEDFAHWSGLAKGGARRALAAAGDALASDDDAANDAPAADVPPVLLLPGFDEYLLGYVDRSACIAAGDFERIVPGGNGVFLPMLVLDGRVRGTWRRRVTRERVDLTVLPFERTTAAQRQAIEREAERFGRYLERPLRVTVEPPSADAKAGTHRRR
ncbi:MAG: winged helix DNA-binding domain-containing protein [Myxococcota bacterium]